MDDDAAALSEFRRLWSVFEGADENKLAVAVPLIENAAFMAARLAELRQAITRDGWSSEYQNGKDQFGTKRSVKADIYLNMSKLYAGVAKQLIDICPPARKANAFAAFMGCGDAGAEGAGPEGGADAAASNKQGEDGLK